MDNSYKIKEFDNMDSAIEFAQKKEKKYHTEFWTRDDEKTFVVEWWE